MIEFKANERTFQGVLLSTFNSILKDSPKIKFDSAFQELNVGVGESRFSDTIITSSVDYKKYNTQIKNVLKSLRSSASYLAVYRDLVMVIENQRLVGLYD